MKLKLGDEEMKHLIKEINVKQADEANEYSWWILFIALVVMEVIVIAKIVSLF